MKKLWTLLAAVFCFAACEDNLADGQQGANEQEDVIVNVSATSAFDYQWQAGDNVKFVFNADSTKTFAVVTSEETTLASISYDVNELEGVVMDENVYVVFPASVETKMEEVTVGGAIESKLHMTYSLSATQDGVITSEENLSYAVIPAEELDGEASVAAQLRSPFAILDVTLPQGVKSVTFTANGSPLAADVTVRVGADAVSDFTVKNSSRVVTVENQNPAGLPASTKVLVLPGNAKPLAVKMDGLDGAMYEKSVFADTTLVAGKVYSVNLTGDVLSINYSIDGGEAAALGQTVAISPLGANMTVSVVSLHEEQPTVSTAADWITVAAQTPVRSFHSDEIQLQIAENTTGQERQAKVTVNYGQDQSKIFTVTQGTIDMSIVQDENGEVIVWEESFGLFASEDLTQQAKAEYKNVFTIEKSDDFSKGAYVIRKMFYAESYWDENRQQQTKTGADYYADMEGDKLIVHKRDEGNSYPFSDNNITLDFNRTEKTFAAGPIELNDGKYIGNYNVKVYEEVQEPEQEEPITGISGTYTATVGFKSNGTPSTKTETITISENTDGKGQYKITGMFDPYGNGGGTYYANYSDGILTILAENAANMYIGSMSSDIKMVNNGIAFESLSGVEAGKYGYVLTSYHAVPNGPITGISGTYTATVGFKSNGTPSTKTETITISENTDGKGQYKITGMFDPYGNGGGTYYANYSDGILTILAENAANMYIGSMSSDIKMALSALSFYSPEGVKAGQYGYELISYTATKK